ncbi:MAG: 30S ribosomal protein S2 [Nitrospinae bacterium CG11_big_fil_rev_8_21_14_0_20_45_15]|nr:MAG: 30S ribosomal protein S2 [Nitrospinae bacterium CG11_big_fil_rev_8_21_14_0_20_45_15]
MTEITMKTMLECGAHFGHQTTRWNPKMTKYIYASRNGIHILNLQKTLVEFRRAEEYVRKMAQEGKKLLFVGTKKQAQKLIADEAGRCGMFFINERWLGGTLTNFPTMRKSIDRLLELERMEAEGEFERLHKKEAVKKRKEIVKLNKFFNGIKSMKGIPDAIFLVDIEKEHIALKEARKLGVKIIALVDSNCNPDGVDLPIPANDDAIRSLKLFISRIADLCLEGQELHRARQAESKGREEKGDRKSEPRSSSKREAVKKAPAPAPVAEAETETE